MKAKTNLPKLKAPILVYDQDLEKWLPVEKDIEVLTVHFNT